jgi:hypothetical protein
MMPLAPARQHIRRPLPQEALDLAPLFAYLGTAQLRGAAPDDDHEVHPRRKKVGPAAEAFTAQTLRPVPAYRPAHLAWRDDSETRRSRWGRLLGDEEREMLRRDAATPRAIRRAALGTGELGVLSHAAIAPE